MKSGAKFFVALLGPVYTDVFNFFWNLNDCIASTHHFCIVLFSLKTAFKNALDKFKRQCFKGYCYDKLRLMLCCQALLKFWLQLDSKENLNTSVPDYCIFMLSI